MGIKHLWSMLTPYCERKPLYELEGKVIAIDLAGWVCESLTVVDYFVHPRQYLKNLFYRTCYLLLEGVIPVFVLEGTAPKLKHKVIADRGEIQFRGVKPKNNSEESKNSQKVSKEGKGRTRFNYVLKNCENLLQCMGLQCIQGPGEAEAFCAYLNKHELVEGVVSQDSDCFAYGAQKVYRNFSVTSGQSSAGQGGSMDVYEMKRITDATGLGQNKIIAMALLCGCDYCPEGINGVGRDSVIKLFQIYKENEILAKIKSWRDNSSYYTELEMKVDDKNICSNCGHHGKTQSHTRSGCTTCKTSKNCNSSLWKEERLLIKAELTLRQKALNDPNFPSQEIIDEFLSEPEKQPKLNLEWSQPNLIRFIKSIGRLLQWTEIYCFQKFLPIFTRWQILNMENMKQNMTKFLIPDIKKKRVLKSIGCFEIIWKDEKGFFDNLIPDDQIKSFLEDNPKATIEKLWTTVEPVEKFEKAYPELVEKFLNSKSKKNSKTTTKTGVKRVRKKKTNVNCSGLNDMSPILKVTEEIDKNMKKTRKSKKTSQQKLPKGLQLITKFMINSNNSSTPQKSSNNDASVIKRSFNEEIFNFTTMNLDDDNEDEFNYSEIINGIIGKAALLKNYNGKNLKYDSIKINMSGTSLNETQDDLALIKINKKRNQSFNLSFNISTKRLHLHRSLDDIQKENDDVDDDNKIFEIISSDSNESIETHVDRFKSKYAIVENKKNISYFFESAKANNDEHIDEFEKSTDFSFLINLEEN